MAHNHVVNSRNVAPLRIAAASVPLIAWQGLLHRYAPTGVTEDVGLRSLVLLFTLFLVWFVALTGWGRAATLLFALDGDHSAGPAERWSLWLSLGSVVASCWVATTMTLGSAGVSVGAILFLAGGSLTWAVQRRATLSSSHGSRWRSLLSGFMILYVLVRIIQATRLARHGDPLYYHLVAPVMWVRDGFIRFDASHPLNFAASLWDYLYLWPAQWLLGARDEGLVAVQLFAQWMHVSIGWLGLGLATIALLRRLRLPPVPSLIGGFAALSTWSLWWTGALAKNDCGAAFWALSGVLLLAGNRQNSFRRYLAAGALIGAAFVAKYTVALLLGPLLIGWSLLFLRQDARKYGHALAAVIVGSLLTAGPILVRNYRGTGLPFFPIALGWAKTTSLSESTREYIDGLSPARIATGWSWRWARLKELAGEGPLAIVSLGAPILLYRRAATRRSIATSDGPLLFILAGPASFAGFLAVGRPGTDFRLLGPGLVLLNVTGTVITLLALRALARATPRLHKIPSGLLVFAAVAATCRFAPEAIVDRLRELPLQREIAHHTGGDAKIWAASHLAPRARIVTSGDNEIYYLLGHDVRVATDDLALDRLWRREVASGATAQDILLRFRSQGFTHLLDTRFPGEVAVLAGLLRPSMKRHPEWTVFQGRETTIVDLRRIESSDSADHTGE